MAPSKTKSKATQKNESTLFDVRTIQRAAEQLKAAFEGYNDKYLQQSWKNWKGFMEDMVRDPSRAVGDCVNDGKNFVVGMKKDLSKTVDDYIKSGKNFIEEIPMIKTVEKKISNGLKSFPARINLASKQDIEKLGKALDTLCRKVDKINKRRTT